MKPVSLGGSATTMRPPPRRWPHSVSADYRLALCGREEQGLPEFRDLKRFTLAITEEVKSELKPLLSKENTRLIFNLEHIEFIDSSAIGCIISLVKTAKSNHSEIKLCNLSKEVMEIINLLHLQMILEIEKDVESALRIFQNKKQ